MLYDRIRRIKCDENRPNCLKCESTMRKCDGYMPQLSKEKSLCTSLSLQTNDTECEKQAFYMFRHSTSGLLAGFFDVTFWKEDLLLAAESYLPIRHAVIGLAAAYQNFTRLDPATIDQRDFITYQYSKCMRLLNQCITKGEISRGSKAIILIANLLLRTLCTLQGFHLEACLHLRSGLALLHQWGVSDSLADSVANGSICPIKFIKATYTQLDTQARLLIWSTARFSQRSWQSHEVSLDGWGTGYLRATTQALSQLVSLHNRIMQSIGTKHFYYGKIMIGEEGRKQFRGELKLWEKKYKALYRAKDDEISLAILPIRIYQLLIRAMTACPSNEGEDLIDESQETCCRKLLDSLTAALQSSGCQEGKPSFKFVGNWVESLYFIAANSSVHKTKLEALRLLETYPLQEGLWSSNVAALTVKQQYVRSTSVEDDMGILE